MGGGGMKYETKEEGEGGGKKKGEKQCRTGPFISKQKRRGMEHPLLLQLLCFSYRKVDGTDYTVGGLIVVAY